MTPCLRICLVVACLVPLYGQVNKSNLTGVIHDPSGAPIPRVGLRLVSTATGVVREEVSDSSGLYRFTLVDFGAYRLEAEATGFRKFIREGIALETGQTTTVDITLEVGTQTESITVTAESPLLRTETGSLGATVTTRSIAELPLKGRNPYMFLQLSAGIQYFGDPGAINPWDNFGPSNFSSNGSKAGAEF